MEFNWRIVFTYQTPTKMKPLYMITDTNGTPLTKVIFDSFEEAEKQSKGFMSKTEIVILYLY